MLFEKSRHPDQSLYIHPGSRGTDNPTILVPAFIERRYDEIAAARGRDGDSNPETNNNLGNYKIHDNRIDLKSPITNQILPPIQETEIQIIKAPEEISIPRPEKNVVINEEKYTENRQIELDECIESTNISPKNCLRHPLKHSWTFWYFNMNGGAASWDENLKEIVSVDTIEGFWAVYHHLEAVCNLESGCDYALFKTGIRPMWEDPANKAGGRWLLTLDRYQRNQWLDQIWLEIMMYLIGGDHKESNTDECINGAVVNIRNKADKISLWLPIADKTQGQHGQQILEVGHELKSRMKIPKHFPIHFETHNSVSTRRGSTAKSEYIL